MHHGDGPHDEYSPLMSVSGVQFLGGDRLSSSFSRFRAAAAFKVV